MTANLASYCLGFARAGEPWHQLPLKEEPELDWWPRLITSSPGGELAGLPLLSALGAGPPWHQPETLRLWVAAHPCGAMPVLETPSRLDFVRMVRALAHRGEPMPMADGVHAEIKKAPVVAQGLVG